MTGLFLVLAGLIGLCLLVNDKLNSDPYPGMGPLQTEWVKSLQKHPERQRSKFLGTGTEKNYKACCLGELHIIGCRYFNRPSPFERGHILDGFDSASLDYSYKKYGLFSHYGDHRNFLKQPLSILNDRSMSWPDIAKMLILNPSAYLSKEV